MLPFPPSNNKRLYSCFVCGFTFSCPTEFKSHIIETHEEGREYIICPVKHCGWTCRDLRWHFAHAHKNLKIPEMQQMQALIMYDIRDPKRRKRIPNFKEGFVISEKNNGKKMHYRSSWEQQTYLCLEQMGDVIAYEVEPIAIDYYYKGKRHKYYPDLRIAYSDGRIVLWEVKPGNQTQTEQNKAKFKAAEHFCMLRGWQFDIITEKKLNLLKKEIKE